MFVGISNEELLNRGVRFVTHNVHLRPTGEVAGVRQGWQCGSSLRFVRGSSQKHHRPQRQTVQLHALSVCSFAVFFPGKKHLRGLDKPPLVRDHQTEFLKRQATLDGVAPAAGIDDVPRMAAPISAPRLLVVTGLFLPT